ncbi:hypothetical protein [uncultured Erythrobacter sp.]|uniref:hypothetical protein n=1 Tax=uncultured Erythrobacter sp. TaxID=263913 RepID=UPI0026342284|nr:hypothetical protein [uncultured Erythrobacter sp.]
MKMLHAAALAIAPVLALSATPALAEEGEKASLTIDSSIEALMANEATKAIVIKHLGPLDQHPFYGQFKGMTLAQVQPMSNGQITDETIEKIKTELSAL